MTPYCSPNIYKQTLPAVYKESRFPPKNKLILLREQIDQEDQQA